MIPVRLIVAEGIRQSSDSIVTTVTLLTYDPVFLAYLVVFSFAAVGCFAGLLRVDQISDREVRNGLTWLLLTSGGWATAHVGYLAAPTAQLQHAFYMIGLIVGFAAVGPWLYFCSAYTGRSLHRSQTIRRVAVVGFLAIVAVKMTNGIHGWYYSTTVVSEPFAHLLVSHEPLHWVVMGIAYALAFVGFFMLFELFLSVGFEVKPLMVLAGITTLPAITDIVGFASQNLLEITYSPLGVAVFSMGVMFVYLDLLQKVRLAGDRDGPAIVLDGDDRIDEFNDAASEAFPILHEASGQQLSEVLPEIATHIDTADTVLKRSENGTTRYYHVTVNSPVSRNTSLSKVVLLSDITEHERYRQELERQNERLDQFASMVSHDLRNPLNVATLRLDTVRRATDGQDEDLSAAIGALERMEALVDDLLALARQGQPVDETVQVSLSSIAHQAWEVVETGDCELTVDSDYQFQADPERVQQLFENLFRNAIDHGEVLSTIRVGRLNDGVGFYIEDDGVGIPAEMRDDVFEFGYTTDDDGTGFGLAIVSEIVDAHQWILDITDGTGGGARFEITTDSYTVGQSDSSHPSPSSDEMTTESSL